MDKVSNIYMFTNKTNNKKYIGQAKDFNKRHKTHIKKSTNKLPIDCAFNKYGKENFEIVILKENLSTQCLLNFWECYYIEKYNTLINNKNGYNISSGGSHGNPFAGKTEEEMNEIKNKMSNNHTDFSGENHPMYKKGYLIRGENNPFYGKHHSEESKEKISDALKELYKNKENHPNYNKSMSEKQKQKISKTRKENEKSKGANNPRAKKVAQYEYDKKTKQQGKLIKIWNYAKQASEELKINHGHIIQCCKGKLKSAGGFKWRYVGDEENGNL